MTHGKKKPHSTAAPAGVARILRELVALPSVHPDADPDGTEPGERAIAEWVADCLRRQGAGVHLASFAPHRPSVVAAFEPRGKVRETVLFMPHLDTVGVAGMTVSPFRLTRCDGRLHGRGACDTKGPMAALLAACGSVARRGAFRESVRFLVVATAGEEQGSLGAGWLLKQGLHADFAVALEPTGLKVVHGAKGILRLRLEVAGKSAHGSRPDRGVNAVLRALPLVAGLQRELEPWLRGFGQAGLRGGTMNVGILRGGGEFNLVPAQCECGVEFRLPPGLSTAAVVARVRMVLSCFGVRARLSVVRSGPAFLTSRDHPWVRRVRAVGRGWECVNWFCDANMAAAYGIPAVAFGPGNMRQAHTRDEFIKTSELDAGTAAFTRLLTV